MPRSNKQPTKSETNTTGALHKISTKSAKISKSTSEAKRTATDASGKPLRVENVKETKVEAMPQSAKKEANQLHQKPEGKNESTRKEAIFTTKNAITSKTSAAIRGKVKENFAVEKSFRNDNMLRKTGTTATEVSKMHPKPQETAERNGSLAGATGANPESAREPSKCFDDWREFYLQIFGSVKSKSDLIVAFTHYILIKNGFRCLGLGDDRTYAEDEVGSLNLPEGWNDFPKYAIRYIYNRMLHLLLAIHLEHRLLINLLNTRTNVVTNITVYPDITVRATCGAPIDVLIPHPEKLAQSLYYNLIQTFTDAANCFRPPKIFSRTSERDNPWKELEARQSQNVNPLDWEASIALGEENQNVQILDADNRQDADSKRDSIISKQFGRRISFNDGNPPTTLRN